jgi:hypothetical protein
VLHLFALSAITASFYLYLSNFDKGIRQSRNAPCKAALLKQLVGYVVDQYGVDRKGGAGRGIL